MKHAIDNLTNHFTSDITALTDEQILINAKKLQGLDNREQYLSSIIQARKIAHIPLTVRYYIELIKKSNPFYAYDLALQLCRSRIKDPAPYYLIADIAVLHNAIAVAKSALNVAIWLNNDSSFYENVLSKFSKKITEKEKLGELDISHQGFWSGKILDEKFILILLSLSLNQKELYDYSIKLLNIFPEKEENYEKVFEVFIKSGELKLMRKYLEFLNQSPLPYEKRNLLVGIMHFYLGEYEQSKSLLRNIAVNSQANSNAKFYLGLNNLIQNDVNSFIEAMYLAFDLGVESSEKKISALLTQSPGIISAALLIFSELQKIKPEIMSDLNTREIIEEITILIEKIFTAKNEMLGINLCYGLVENFQHILPKIDLYVSELFIKYGMIENAKKFLNVTNDHEKHRLMAWIYRIEEENDLANAEMEIYRKTIPVNEDNPTVYKMTELVLTERDITNEEEALTELENVYKQVDEIKKNMQVEYGIDSSTCMKQNCNECCKNTFPRVTYIEYLFMRNWFEKQPENFKEVIIEKSKNIVEQYKDKYKTNPSFMNRDLPINKMFKYLNDFKFDCPFLGDKGCTVYEAQPFMCRVYGYCSSNKVEFQGCNFFLEQINKATKLSFVRKLIDSNPFYEFAKKIDKGLINSSVMAPIPVWFAKTHEESKWFAKFSTISTGFFAPFFNFISKRYLKTLNEKKKELVN